MRGWAWAAGVILAVGCGDKFFAAESSHGGEAGAAGAEPGPEEGGAPDGGTTPAGGGSVGGASPGGGRPSGGAPGGGLGGGLPLGGGGGSGGVIIAPSIPADGLELWFDALVGVTQEDGGVAEWQDRSPHARHAFQEEVSQRPLLAAEALNGKPSVVFDGDDDLLQVPTLPGDFTAGVTIFTVARTDSNTQCMAYFEASNGSEQEDVHLGFYQAHYLYEVADPFLEVKVDQVLHLPEVVVGVQQAIGDVEVRRNGKSIGSSKFDLPVLTPREHVFLGNTEYGGCTVLDGRISELLVYSRGLSPDEVSRVEAYLQQKWACCAD
ncbi:MAG: hypothetical protein EOO73_01240 [Myxococcales bacterium]|nr:MAG: hypothetical protein EOO73_01240 [Myxococcales bacterium]